MDTAITYVELFKPQAGPLAFALTRIDPQGNGFEEATSHSFAHWLSQMKGAVNINASTGGWTCYVYGGTPKEIASLREEMRRAPSTSGVIIYLKMTQSYELYELSNPANAKRLLALKEHLSTGGCPDYWSKKRWARTVSLHDPRILFPDYETTSVSDRVYSEAMTHSFSTLHPADAGFILPRVYPLEPATIFPMGSKQAVYDVLYRHFIDGSSEKAPPIFEYWFGEKIGDSPTAFLTYVIANVMKRVSYPVDDTTIAVCDAVKSAPILGAVVKRSKSIVSFQKGLEVRISSELVLILDMEKLPGSIYTSPTFDLVEAKLPPLFRDFRDRVSEIPDRHRLAQCTTPANRQYRMAPRAENYEMWRGAFVEIWNEVLGTAELFPPTFKVKQFEKLVLPKIKRIKVNMSGDVRNEKKYRNLSLATVLLSQVSSDSIEDGFFKAVYNTIWAINK